MWSSNRCGSRLSLRAIRAARAWNVIAGLCFAAMWKGDVPELSQAAVVSRRVRIEVQHADHCSDVHR